MHFETCFKINSKGDDQTDNGHVWTFKLDDITANSFYDYS